MVKQTVDKNAVKVIDGLLVQIAIVRVMQTNKHLDVVQEILLKNDAGYISDALKYLKKAIKQGHGEHITLANYDWIKKIK